MRKLRIQTIRWPMNCKKWPFIPSGHSSPAVRWSGPFRWYWSSEMLLRADNRYHCHQDRERHFGKSSRSKRSKMGSQSRCGYHQLGWRNTQKLRSVSCAFIFRTRIVMQMESTHIALYCHNMKNILHPKLDSDLTTEIIKLYLIQECLSVESVPST